MLYFLLGERIHKSDYLLEHGTRSWAISLWDLREWIKKTKEKFDAIISPSYPFYIQKYAYILKKKLKISNWMPYLLDPHADNTIHKGSKKELLIEQENRIFKNAVRIFLVEEIITKAKYSPIKMYKDKVELIPTHLLIDNTLYHEENKSKEIHFIYTGRFDPTIRNPEKLLCLFTRLPQNYILDLYSRWCDDIIEKYTTLISVSL